MAIIDFLVGQQKRVHLIVYCQFNPDEAIAIWGEELKMVNLLVLSGFEGLSLSALSVTVTLASCGHLGPDACGRGLLVLSPEYAIP